LHQLCSIDPRVPVIWVDTGYNTRDTYLVAQRLIDDLQLNIHIYTPAMTSARRDALMGIPTPDDEVLHKEFSRQVKLQPFQRALDDFRPEVWLSGLRHEETDFRKTLDIVSWDSRGILKVAPIFYWTDDQVRDYMEQHQLPSCRRYFDPTKVSDNRECGMHTGA
jgi:phosphoadenosine phosphosulfate reductase